MAHPTIPSEQLRVLIAHTFSQELNVRKPAEDQLIAAQTTPGHLLELLKLVASSDAADAAVRQAAAVRFKNVISKGWDVNREDGTEGIVISEQDRVLIKNHLVQLMCTTPPQIQLQLSESISLIAKVDYPEKWTNLLGELVQQLNSTDVSVLHGVLKTADSIFSRFRHVERSDDLYRVIVYTLEGFQAPLLTLFKRLGQAVDAAAHDGVQLKAHLQSLCIMCNIFYSLNYQDLPEFFEDHMGDIMQEFEKYLKYKNPIVVDPDEDKEPSPIDSLQAAIIDILELYASKDEECFIVFLPQLSSMVWNLLMSITPLPKHDALATTSIRFLSLLIKNEMHKELFKDDATLRQIVLNIVIPNLMFRDSDEERFEDDPREFIVTEVEGSDSESRRRCSQDLLKAMCLKFELQTTAICSEHIAQMLADYRADPDSKWVSKDAAIHLMMGISIRRESYLGVSEVNQGVNLMEFFQTQILPELQDANFASRPVVKATCLKFVSTFRNQFAKEHLVQLIPVVIVHLNSPVVVVHTFAAYTLERILVTKEADENGIARPKIGGAELREFLDPLFSGLFKIVENTENDENDYVMKCIMRALATAGPDIIPVTQSVIEKLTAALSRVAKNPRNPQYNHYLFESLAVLIKNVCSDNPEATAGFEAFLFQAFTEILQLDVAELTPYAFQILAQLLEFRPAGSGLGPAYSGLFPPLMKPSIWEKKGNVPALSRLLQAYISQAAPDLVSQLTPILGVFQKLLASKATETSAFDILTSVVVHFPQEAITPHLRALVQLLLVRLQGGKTPRYTRLVTTFFAVMAGKFGAQIFFECTNAIQNGLPLMLLRQVWLPRLNTDPPKQFVEAKTHVIGLTRLMCDTPLLLADRDGQEAWVGALVAVVSLLTSASLFNSQLSDKTDDGGMEIEIGYDAVFSRLVFAARPVEDPFADIADPKDTFTKSLHAMLAHHREQVLPLIQHGLSGDVKLSTGLENMFQQAGLSLTN